MALGSEHEGLLQASFKIKDDCWFPAYIAGMPYYHVIIR